jgi:hypothetical protein
MSKELFMDAHEQLVEEYMEKHPNADWSEAYEKTSDMSMGRMRSNLADRADYLRMKEKEG